MNDLYKYIDSWEGNRVWLYTVVFIFIVWIFYNRHMGVNSIVAIIVGMFVISYLNNRSIVAADTQKDIHKFKKDNIKPKLNDSSEKHEEIVNLLFSIQDMYAYSPQQYENMIKYIDQFYDKYQLSFVDNKTSHVNYGLMKQYKREAINSLMSIIYSLPDDPKVRNKLNTASIILDSLMTKHLDQISYLVDEDIYKTGYNVDSKIIHYGVKPFNEYDDIFNIFSYEIV